MQFSRAKRPHFSGASPVSRARGFSLVELSVVLVVIGLIIGAVSIGKDVHRNAVNQRIASEFIQGWLLAYDSYVTVTGVVPKDNVSIPTGCVNGDCATPTELCDDKLRNAMLAAGVGLPQGRAEGREDRYVYLDSNGLPHDIKICFRTVNWSEPNGSVGSYAVRPRNVMIISGLTPALASFLDHYFDTVVDARFGNFREKTYANANNGTKRPWSGDDTVNYAGTKNSHDEDQIVELTGYMKMQK
ncbi:prepilin-type N-terminal cleavage/methylation domain-containing protein [Betaproteobacteria bacterium]|nr:prepilin-type N-terminal cleavage/methylation domain-containing protein [Betaproteobacteria bacterium]